MRLERRSLNKRSVHCRGGFSLVNAVIKDCNLAKEHAVAAIVKAESCQQSSFAKRKVRLSNVLFENNTNLGGSVGLVVRDPSCRGAVELRDVAFEGNEYSKASVLARENTLVNVSVVANRKITNKYNRKTHFFHFPDDSTSTVTNMTATGNANAPVLYVERGNLNVSSSFFQNNTGKYSTVVRVLSSSLTMHETRFLNNESKRRIVAVAAVKKSSIYFSSCTFVGNVGGKKSSGIVSASTPREISFLSCDFVDNVLKSFSAATVVLEGNGPPVNDETRQNTTANFTHCTFLRNECFYVTAVRIFDFYSDSVLFDSCEVRNNKRPDSSIFLQYPVNAAVIQVEHTYAKNFTTRNCTFHSNSGNNVLLFLTVYGNVWIRNTSFSDTRTPVAGYSTTPTTKVLSVRRRTTDGEDDLSQTLSNKEATFTVEDSDFKGNGGESAGSAVYVLEDLAWVELRRSLFLGNRGEKGAAVFAERIYHLLVDNCTFVQNKAEKAGGALRIERVKDAFRHIVIQNSAFIKNEGTYGGAIDTVEGFVVKDSHFRENRASIRGGAMHIDSNGFASFFKVVRNNTFTRNVGRHGGAIDAAGELSIEDSHFRENRAAIRGGAINFECPLDDRQSSICHVEVRRSTFTRNRAVRSGGAIQVNPASELETTACRFQKNNATFGGGISFFRGQGIAQNTVFHSKFAKNHAEMGGEKQDPFGTFERSFDAGAISLLTAADAEIVDEQATDRQQTIDDYLIAINNTAFVHNIAMQSGAGIYAETPSLLIIDGTPVKALEKTFNCQTMERPPSNAFGKKFHNNTVIRGYEDNLASLSVDFCLYVFKGGRLVETISEDKKYMLPNWRSGDDFPVLRVVMYDAFGNNFSRTRNKDILKLTAGHQPEDAYDLAVHLVLSSKTEAGTTSPFLSNIVTEDITFGAANISLGNPFVKSEIYTLTLLVEGFERQGVTLEVQVRDCTINEESNRDDTFCRPCDSNQYNFHSAGLGWNCTICPDNADCTTAFIFPQRGYWNAFPCSNQMERCVYADACNFTGSDMAEDLTRSETPCVFIDDVIEQYHASQCAAEYEGPLCGSCLDDAGRLGSFVCTPCMSDSLAVVGQLGILVFQLILALLPIRETLNAESDQLEDRTTTSSLARRTSRAIRPPGRYESFGGGPSSRGSRSAKKRGGGTTQSTARKVNRAKRRFLGTLKVTCPLDRDRISVLCCRSPSIFSRRWLLQPRWTSRGTSPPSLSSEHGVSSRTRRESSLMLTVPIVDSMGAAASVGASLFLDCLLSGGSGTPRTVKRQIIVALLSELVALVISAFFLLQELKGDKDWNRLLRRVILAHVVVGYNSYLALVKIAVDAFNCVRVHDGIRLEDVETTHRYWIADTSVECFRGSHLTLTLAVSVPLLLFAILFPLLLAILLERARKEDTLSSKWTQETMGFLFIVFEERYLYWDCLILIRKAVLSVIIVFGYRLGGNLQGLLVMAVLVIALVLQTHLNPFSQNLGNLNALESASLLVSHFTFLCGLVLDSERFRGDVIEGLLTALLLSINILLFLILAFTLAQSKLEQIRLELEVLQVDGSDGAFYVVIWSYLAYQLDLLREQMKKKPDSVDSDDETNLQPSIELSVV